MVNNPEQITLFEDYTDDNIEDDIME